MSPKSRPFDEVAKDVFADEGNALQPVHSDAAAHLAEKDVAAAERREFSLLRYLVGLHQDAVAFYKTAADSTRYHNLEKPLRGLERLHQAQVEALGLRLRASSVSPDIAEAAAGGRTRQTFIFGDVIHMLTSDLFPLNVADAAERKTVHTMEAAAGDDEIPADAQLLLASQAGQAARAFELLEEIGVLQER